MLLDMRSTSNLQAQLTGTSIVFTCAACHHWCLPAIVLVYPFVSGPGQSIPYANRIRWYRDRIRNQRNAPLLVWCSRRRQSVHTATPLRHTRFIDSNLCSGGFCIVRYWDRSRPVLCPVADSSLVVPWTPATIFGARCDRCGH